MPRRHQERAARWSAVAFFAGLALVCSAIVQIGRWPWLQVAIYRADVEPDEARWRLDFTDLAGLVGLRHAEVELLLGLLAAAAIAALVSLALHLTTRDTLPVWPVYASFAAGMSVVMLALTPRLIFHDAVAVVVFLGLLAVATTPLAFGLAAGLPLRRGSVAAACFALAATAGAVHYAVRAGWLPPLSPDTTGEASARPVWLIGAAVGGGLVVALWTRCEVKGRPALALLVSGLALLPTSLAIARDERSVAELHPGHAFSPPPAHTGFAPARRCAGSAELAPEVQVLDGEVRLPGRLLGRTSAPDALEPLLVERLLDLRQQYIDLHSAAGDPLPILPRDLNLIAEAGTPLPAAAAILRAARQTGHDKLSLVSIGFERNALRTRPYDHRHTCVVPVELADDGVLLSSFADWPSLVKAADEATTPLRLSPR